MAANNDEEKSFEEQLEAFQRDLDVVLEKHRFQELYRKLIEQNSLPEMKKPMNKRAIAAYKKSQKIEDDQ